MKREVGVYFFAILLVVAVFFSFYFFNIKPTGFAIFSQPSDLSLGVRANTTYNGSAVILNSSMNSTSGYYTSPILDSNYTNTTWNNLTWTGNIPQNSSLSFQATVCLESNCSNATLTNVSSVNNTIDLSGLGQGQYLKYRALFSIQNLNTTSPSLTGVSYFYTTSNGTGQNQTNQTSQTDIQITVSQPSGSQNSGDIPLQFTSTGNDSTCWYDIYNATDNSLFRSTQSLSGCNNVSITFPIDSSSAGSYTLNIYVNDSLGLVQKAVTFNVVSSGTTSNTDNTSNVQNQNESTNTVTTPTPKVTQISPTAIPSQDVIQGDSKNLTLTLQNTGTEPVSSCQLSFTGDNAVWASSDGQNQSLAAGASVSYPFSVNIPLETSTGAYTIGLSVTCAETSANEDLALNIIQKKLDFNITNVQRTSQSKVRVDYSLKELTGNNQNVSILFYIIDNSSTQVANVSQNKSINANKTGKYSVNIPINESLEGNLTLSATVNSETYSSSVLEPITLGAPIGGFAIFGDQGTATGSVIVLVALIIIVVLVLFFVRKRMKKSSKSSE